MNWRNLTVRAVLTAALLGAIVWIGLHREVLGASALEEELGRFGAWAPIMFVLLYALATVLFVPGSVLTLAGGALFGPIWGTLLNLIGATLGATFAFLIARYVASDLVAARSGEQLGRMMRGVEEEGWRFVAFVRLVPLFPFNLMNYAFALTRIRLREYVLASFVCMAPGALAYTYLGYAGREAASGQAGAIRKAVVALALLAAVAFLPGLVRRIRGQRFTDLSTLQGRLQNGEQVALIDVRSAEEFRGPLGHIAGAINIPVAELSGRIRDLTDLRQRPLVTI
jgi:uncharacterized membrane protein YdjX (TVP38/TMEM64 family)